MSQVTDIQWCDSTVNPIMGCRGCELFPIPKKVTAAIDKAVAAVGAKIVSYTIFEGVVSTAYEQLKKKLKKPGPEFKNDVTTTNIWQLRNEFVENVRAAHGKKAADAAMTSIRQSITCYAAKQHTNKGVSLLPTPFKKDGTGGKTRGVKKNGYAPTFEVLTPFPKRAKTAANYSDLLGQSNPATPWKDGLARMIFVSDMGDALCEDVGKDGGKVDNISFLKENLMPAIESENGKRHLWLWLTKQPAMMVKFADSIGGFPKNVCAMTTVTNVATLGRVAVLRKVKASCRGLSIEPLWESLPPEKLDLKGIDWVIVGGESGSGKDTRPFALEWAEEMVAHCRNNKVACFVKQIGRNPTKDGKPYKFDVKRIAGNEKFTDKVTDPHGGDWSEWPDTLQVRDFPKYFHDYRKKERKAQEQPRPTAGKKKVEDEETGIIDADGKAEFERLNEIVRNGVAAFMECGTALMKIKEKKLYRAGGFKTWEEYCRKVVGISTPYAHRLIEATEFAIALKETLPNGNKSGVLLPVTEAQVRPLNRLKDKDKKAQADKRVEAWKMATVKAGGQPTQVEVAEVVFEILQPDKKKEPPKPGSRTAIRADIMSKLKVTVQARTSWDDAARHVRDLEDLDGE